MSCCKKLNYLSLFQLCHFSTEQQKIIPLHKNDEIYSIFCDSGIPKTILNKMSFFSIPEEKRDEISHEYNQRFGKNAPCSYEDYFLAYIADDNDYGIISYDKHLKEDLKKFFSYRVYEPNNINNTVLKHNQFVLLDTNILMPLLDGGKTQDWYEIYSMFSYAGDRFLICNEIVEEFKRVKERYMNNFSNTKEKYEQKRRFKSYYVNKNYSYISQYL